MLVQHHIAVTTDSLAPSEPVIPTFHTTVRTRNDLVTALRGQDSNEQPKTTKIFLHSKACLEFSLASTAIRMVRPALIFAFLEEFDSLFTTLAEGKGYPGKAQKESI